jgi:hypothetical protein
MARGKQTGALVERVVDEKTHRVAEIKLDKRRMVFSCTIGVDSIESRDGGEVRAWARKMLAANVVVTWIPVMEISSKQERDYSYRRNRGDSDIVSAGFKISAERYWIARTPAGEWRMLGWGRCDEDAHECLAPEVRLQHSESYGVGNSVENPPHRRFDKEQPRAFTLPYTSGDTSCLPYTEAGWLGVAKLIDSVKQAQKFVEKITTTQRGFAALRAAGEGTLQLALPGAGKSSARDETVVDVEPIAVVGAPRRSAKKATAKKRGRAR